MSLKKLPFDPIINQWFGSMFKSPSPPQLLGWPKIAQGENTLIFAPTGSGKTLAAFLWCINDLFQNLKSESEIKNSQIHTLYISPLKALNNDIERNLRNPIKGIWDLAKSKNIKVAYPKVSVRTGDTPPHVRQNMVKQPPHILITTPESLYLLITSQRGRQIFKNLKYLIVDEIHALSNNKRGVHLSLTLERLETLVEKSPVRIGLSATQRPLDRIAAYLGGLEFSEENNKYLLRPVTIINCGQKKELDIQVISPVNEFSDLPDATVWPNVIKQCYKLISDHKTTLIFANMRAQTEKMVRQLNDYHHNQTGDQNSEIALAHHGSMSREMRFEVEERLKHGQIPAVVATASLELGIDIGSIDLVIHLESPKSISGSIQRIGRSGHLITSKSKGRIIPLYPGDLDDAIALTKGIIDGELEETQIPENCLDVLAQQILAETAMNPIKIESMLGICHRSYCYHSLTQQAFNNILQMLEGRFADSKLPALQQIIIWDRVNNMISARRGSKISAVMNGGTIPDRGYFSVVLSGQNSRLGEVEEEFVFESRVGDIFFLGNSEWRIDNITNDRINVSPVKSIKPRAPFWKGEIPYRSYETSLKTGRFRHLIEQRIDKESTKDWLIKEYKTDQQVSQNLISFLQKQKSLTGYLPTHQRIVAEWFYDSANELNLILHAGFGARVNGLWAIAVSSLLERYYKTEVQFTFNDDGFLFRIQDTTEKPDIERILKLPFQEVEETLLNSISAAPIFAIQFRYNATRAQLLPRSRHGKRIPLWLQRLRAADLLQAIRQYKDFPILIETYRSCLYEVFDLDALKDVITNINENKIHLHQVRTPYPSPMASGLIFNFVTYQMYDYDRSRAPADAAFVSSEVLSQIISREETPAIIDQDLIEEATLRWQNLAPETKARDKDELFLLVKKLEPVLTEDLKDRSLINVDDTLQKLKQEKRIEQLLEKTDTWVTTELSDINDTASETEVFMNIIKKFMEVHGPVLPDQISSKLHIAYDIVLQSLSKLRDQKLVIQGQMVKNSDQVFWCNSLNFAELYRRAIGNRRKKTVALNRSGYYKFLMNWHFSKKRTEDIINQYQFLPLDFTLFENELLRARIFEQSRINPQILEDDINELMNNGKFIIRYQPNISRFIFHHRGEGAYLNFGQSDFLLNETEKAVCAFLKENGASLIRDLEDGLDLMRYDLTNILKSLVLKDIITCDNYSSFKQLTSKDQEAKIKGKRKGTRVVILRGKLQFSYIETARWSLTSSFSVLGKSRTLQEQSEFQARILLQRYGVLVKEMYRHETGLLPWFDIFQVLKKLEWQGEIRRGYFVSGLSGIQFASHEAVEMLENLEAPLQKHLMLSVVDPALPFGSQTNWEIKNQLDQSIDIVRNAGNHLFFFAEIPIVYLENYAKRIWLLKDFQTDCCDGLVDAIKIWLKFPEDKRPRRKIVIEMINGKVAIDSEIAGYFLERGFEKDQKNLVLWPSGV
jgi:ATP-dependent helicase Lhr and Lhr-like helicase